MQYLAMLVFLFRDRIVCPSSTFLYHSALNSLLNSYKHSWFICSISSLSIWLTILRSAYTYSLSLFFSAKVRPCSLKSSSKYLNSSFISFLTSYCYIFSDYFS
jgi:hypothetical protein